MHHNIKLSTKSWYSRREIIKKYWNIEILKDVEFSLEIKGFGGESMSMKKGCFAGWGCNRGMFVEDPGLVG